MIWTHCSDLKREEIATPTSSTHDHPIRSHMHSSPSQRSLVITSMHSHVRRLARHTDAAEVLEMAYNDFANAHQRASLVQEFYGPQFALLGGPRGQTLEDVLKSSPDQKAAILKNLKETLSPLLSK